MIHSNSDVLTTLRASVWWVGWTVSAHEAASHRPSSHSEFRRIQVLKAFPRQLPMIWKRASPPRSLVSYNLSCSSGFQFLCTWSRFHSPFLSYNPSLGFSSCQACEKLPHDSKGSSPKSSLTTCADATRQPHKKEASSNGSLFLLRRA